MGLKGRDGKRKRGGVYKDPTRSSLSTREQRRLLERQRKDEMFKDDPYYNDSVHGYQANK